MLDFLLSSAVQASHVFLCVFVLFFCFVFPLRVLASGFFLFFYFGARVVFPSVLVLLISGFFQKLYYIFMNFFSLLSFGEGGGSFLSYVLRFLKMYT